MADRIISSKLISRIWKRSIEDNSKSIEFLKKDRKFEDFMLENIKVGYIDYFKFGENFFLKDVIVFPLFDASGKLKGLNTRKLYDKFFIKFVSSNYPLIYSDYEFYNKTLVLTESPICAETLKPFLPDMCVSASLSASITVQHLTMYSVAKKIITVLDNDDAGLRSSNSILEYNPNTYILPQFIYESWKDPNEMFDKDRDSFDTMVEYIKKIDRRT